MAVTWTRYGSSKGSRATINGVDYVIRGTYNRSGQCYELYRRIQGSYGSVCVGMYRTISEARAAAAAEVR